MVKNISYQDSLKYLNNEQWKTLNVDEKINVLQVVENEMANRSQRLPCEISAEPMPSSDNSIQLGGYSPASKDISLNSEQLMAGSKYGNDYSVHLDTTLHEGRHAYQDQAVTGIVQHSDKAELEAWRDNMKPGHYIDYEQNPRRYFSQPIEQDARAFAAKQSQQVELDKNRIQVNDFEQKQNSAKTEYLHQMGESKSTGQEAAAAAKAALLVQHSAGESIGDASEKTNRHSISRR